jgi:hypothetical protein
VDVVEQWSRRVAQRVTPEEADFAAEVGAAYAAGGKARRNLWPGYNTQPGAFGPGASAADLPMILHALAYSGQAILALLRGPYVADTVAASGLLAVVKLTRDQRRPERPGRMDADGVADLPPPGPLTERQAVGHAFESLSGRLSEAGFAPERADQIAHDLIAELLTDTAGAAMFVECLTVVPPSGMPAAGSGRPGERRGSSHRWPRQGSKGP